MDKVFTCSLCHNGVLGGALFVDDAAITYKTGKVTVDARYRNLRMEISAIKEVTWKWVLFPMASFRMKNGECFRFLIFNKGRFEKALAELGIASSKE